jgi:hypothetical protein
MLEQATGRFGGTYRIRFDFACAEALYLKRRGRAEQE